MAGPTVRAGDLPEQWVRGRWPPSAKLRPQYRRLGMGRTHAVYVLCSINTYHIKLTIASSERFAQDVLLNDATVRSQRWLLTRAFVAVYAHLDDVGLIGGRLGAHHGASPGYRG